MKPCIKVSCLSPLRLLPFFFFFLDIYYRASNVANYDLKISSQYDKKHLSLRRKVI